MPRRTLRFYRERERIEIVRATKPGPVSTIRPDRFLAMSHLCRRRREDIVSRISIGNALHPNIGNNIKCQGTVCVRGSVNTTVRRRFEGCTPCACPTCGLVLHRKMSSQTLRAVLDRTNPQSPSLSKITAKICHLTRIETRKTQSPISC